MVSVMKHAMNTCATLITVTEGSAQMWKETLVTPKNLRMTLVTMIAITNIVILTKTDVVSCIVILTLLVISQASKMMYVMCTDYRKAATLMEEIVVLNVLLVAILSCFRMFSVKRHVIIKTATLIEDIVFNVPLVAIKS